MRSISRTLAALALSAAVLTLGGCTAATPVGTTAAPSPTTAIPSRVETPRDHAAEARLRVAWARAITTAADSHQERQSQSQSMTAEECDEYAMSSNLSNAELYPELRSIGCGWRLDELERQAVEDSSTPPGTSECPPGLCGDNGEGMTDEAYEACVASGECTGGGTDPENLEVRCSNGTATVEECFGPGSDLNGNGIADVNE